MNYENIKSNKKKLTLQGFNNNKLKKNLDNNLNYQKENRIVGTTIVKKRKKRTTNEINERKEGVITNSRLNSLTEKEQISRINAVVHNAILLEEKKNIKKEEQPTSEKKDIKKEIDNRNLLNFQFREIEKKVLINDQSDFKKSKTKIENENYSEKKTLKFSKDIYSKHSKLIIDQSIDDKIDQYVNFKEKFGIKNKKSRNSKGKNISREIILPEKISIKELSFRMAEDSREVLAILKKEINKNYELNDIINKNIAYEIVKRFNHTAKQIKCNKEENLFSIENRKNLTKKTKPPIVTLMGHIDHGKTSLLDAFLQSNFVEKEPGGITQHISAYQIITKNKQKITFIDTPGHEAFTSIRTCSTNITNIIVIVIAADDGIMEQTIEVINHAKKSKASIIVAINKIDKLKSNNNIKKIINTLPKYNLIPEELGGDVIVVPVSAKKKINLDKLEEAILLIADLMKLEAIEDCRALGWVIESKIDKMKGISATLIIEEGTLKIGDILIVGTTYGKVRNMYNYLGQKETIALPSTPIKITGLNNIPNAGDKFIVVNSEKNAREIITSRLEEIKKREKNLLIDNHLNVFYQDQKDKIEKLPIILKCDVNSSIEAISTSINKINNHNNNQVSINIIHKATGGITNSDILLAKAAKAVIIAFNIKIDSKTKNLVKQKNVEVRTYKVIYELIDDVKTLLNKILKPLTQKIRVGSASIRQVFNISKADSIIIGCYINNGIIKRDSLIRIVRVNKLIYEGKLKALRRFKNDVTEVTANLECGISINSNSSIQAGDTIEIYQLIEKENKILL